MKHLFIINPAAGQGEAIKLQEKILALGEELALDIEIYQTKGLGDGEDKARQAAASHESIRIYSCGGDGTLNEIINGAYGFPHVEIASVPKGTGNDFVRNFPGDFGDIRGQMLGTAVDCDLIRYTSQEGVRYCANMFNVGFDSNVVDMTSRLKKKPLIGGSFAYLLGVLIILIKKEGAHLTIELEDGTRITEPILLIAIANGSYCGGGVKGVPLSQTDDGLMDVSIVKNVSRRVFVSLFPKYAKGTHLETKKGKEVVEYLQCRRITVAPVKDTMRMAVDGEIVDAGRTEFEIVPKGFRFVLLAEEEEQ
ncbi:MAG: diacylglycerol/lipid kinase family protein [Anaerovoracaceae bacterium]|jgi:diacylglycerol kinase (ATP)